MVNLLMLFMLFFIFPALFLCSALLTFAYIHYAQRKNWLDLPSQRGSHTKPTPRGGGLVFVGLWLITVVISVSLHLITWRQMMALLPGTMIVAIVGFYDDRFSLAVKYRTLWYLLAAIISLGAVGGISHISIGQDFIVPLGWLGSVLAVLAVLWSTNLFNFMDGIDGIAAVEALFLLGVGGFFLWQAGGQGLAFVTWSLVAYVLGFLFWNKPPAKLFMGDVGSVTLGFIVIVVAFIGETQYQVPAILWIMIYGAFIFDTTITLLRRFLAKHKWYEPHRLHAYQRLHQAGLSHGKVVWIFTGVNSLLSALAIAGFYFPHGLFISALLVLEISLLTWLYIKLERIKPMELHSDKKPVTSST
jgi:glycosyltransferase WbpL